MSDLIKREDAIEAYSDIYWIDDRLNLAFREELDKIDEKIRNIPTVEIADRPRGEWKPFDLTWGRSIYACSVCEEAIAVPCGWSDGKPIYDYCPMCGARMKGADDE